MINIIVKDDIEMNCFDLHYEIKRSTHIVENLKRTIDRLFKFSNYNERINLLSM